MPKPKPINPPTIEACRTCMHPQRKAIETAIMDHTQSLASVADQYQISSQSLGHHYQHHMSGVITEYKEDILKKEAIKRVNSIEKMNETFALWDDIYQKLMLSLDPEADDYARKLAIAQQMIKTMSDLIKTNAKIVGDDRGARSAGGIDTVIDALQKEIKEKTGRNVKMVTFEPVPEAE